MEQCWCFDSSQDVGAFTTFAASATGAQRSIRKRLQKLSAVRLNSHFALCNSQITLSKLLGSHFTLTLLVEGVKRQVSWVASSRQALVTEILRHFTTASATTTPAHGIMTDALSCHGYIILIVVCCVTTGQSANGSSSTEQPRHLRFGHGRVRPPPPREPSSLPAGDPFAPLEQAEDSSNAPHAAPQSFAKRARLRLYAAHLCALLLNLGHAKHGCRLLLMPKRLFVYVSKCDVSRNSPERYLLFRSLQGDPAMLVLVCVSL